MTVTDRDLRICAVQEWCHSTTPLWKPRPEHHQDGILGCKCIAFKPLEQFILKSEDQFEELSVKASLVIVYAVSSIKFYRQN